MQRFIAELSKQIDKGDFDRSWQSASGIDRGFTLDFVFDGRRILITIDSPSSVQWQSDNFQRTFSRAINRVDQHCNIRWL